MGIEVAVQPELLIRTQLVCMPMFLSFVLVDREKVHSGMEHLRSEVGI
jgi:hypothetical protein